MTANRKFATTAKKRATSRNTAKRAHVREETSEAATEEIGAASDRGATEATSEREAMARGTREGKTRTSASTATKRATTQRTARRRGGREAEITTEGTATSREAEEETTDLTTIEGMTETIRGTTAEIRETEAVMEAREGKSQVGGIRTETIATVVIDMKGAIERIMKEERVRARIID